MSMNVGFIGCGNMGGALARAAAKSELLAPQQLFIADRMNAQAERMAAELGGAKVSNNEEVAAVCDYIFLAVKPQMMRDVLAGIAPVLKARTDRFVLVTIAAGIAMESIQEMAGGEYPVIRLMPNMPAAVGKGMILYCSSKTNLPEMVNFLHMMKEAGRFDELPENLIDAGSAVSGCGPAFVYMFIEALADGGVACGLPRQKAQEFAAQTLLGSAKLLEESGKHPSALKDAVCSPGGSTIAGVRALEEGGIRAAAINAVIAAHKRNGELGK